MRGVDGRLDGKSQRQLVYTIPVSVGFVAVAEALRAIGNPGKVIQEWGALRPQEQAGMILHWRRSSA